MSNTTRILLGLVLGAIAGVLLAWLDAGLAAQAAGIAQPMAGSGSTPCR